VLGKEESAGRKSQASKNTETKLTSREQLKELGVQTVRRCFGNGKSASSQTNGSPTSCHPSSSNLRDAALRTLIDVPLRVHDSARLEIVQVPNSWTFVSWWSTPGMQGGDDARRGRCVAKSAPVNCLATSIMCFMGRQTKISEREVWFCGCDLDKSLF
jgi:hypothetical protein